MRNAPLFLILLSGVLPWLLCQCGRVEPADLATRYEIVGVSGVPPNPDAIPYPDALAICRCMDTSGHHLLVAVPAFADRQYLESFLSIETGRYLVGELTSWVDRPIRTHAMFTANDYGDEYDLVVYYTETFEVE